MEPFLFSVSTFISVGVCTGAPQSLEEGVRTSGTRVTGGCELPLAENYSSVAI